MKLAYIHFCQYSPWTARLLFCWLTKILFFSGSLMFSDVNQANALMISGKTEQIKCLSKRILLFGHQVEREKTP